ncbi:LADA_0C11298g1_1 [Lachancea dasiensis]|uniref:LADA_0C11298g1_1 n=1 Tax=Lachancea dasiensis TaxID=1072105 RepID=A0A1G4J1X6_9SACH|nr:LADA_0C11298g1_1 [Lachancea dasiensis]
MNATPLFNMEPSIYLVQHALEDQYLPSAAASAPPAAVPMVPSQHLQIQQPATEQHPSTRQRTQWTQKEDACLLESALTLSHILVGDLDFKARKLFWHHVSQTLMSDHLVSKNRRQCRDRFKLLYQRAVSRNTFDRHLQPTTQVEVLSDKCTRMFKFSQHRELTLNTMNNGSPPSPTIHASSIPPSRVPTSHLIATPSTTSSLASTIKSPRRETDNSGDTARTALPIAHSWSDHNTPFGNSPLESFGNSIEYREPTASTSWEIQTVVSTLVSMKHQINHLSNRIECIAKVLSVNDSHVGTESLKDTHFT